VLIAGSPGQGKTTFARALAINYSSENKIVKTIEAPRDMLLPENITQLAITYGSPEEIQDILLLSRPDYTIFDEMRNTKDFKLFADLRMSGVGMVGVIHATSAVDAVQRFIGRIELGVIPQVIDTVIFIDKGDVAKIYSLKMTVKVPVGMIEADLARPVVVVNDFYTGKLEFEIYSYGEETVVIPLGDNDIDKILEKQLKKRVEKIKENKFKVYVPENEIKYAEKKISRLEKEYGIDIKIEKLAKDYSLIKFDIEVEKRYINLNPKKDNTGKEVDIYIEDEYLLTAKIGKNNSIKINKESDIGKGFIIAISSKKKIELRV
jgi:ATPase